MEAVSNGQLEIRMNEENAGEDFKKLALGFNSMMEEIYILMEQVKLEQQQLQQIRFNALQAQIKPHFLYNTLDCIHWQALADGNKEVSTLVKALASYYRICLSKGKDIITLSQEISHIENYLIIQNMRYDNIVESEINVKGEFLEVKIPKMTLQPLVENAIYHGIKIKDGHKGKIIIMAAKDKEDVIIEVTDSGSGMTEEQIGEINNSISEVDETFGYGVRNVNKRIEIMFGKQYGLHFIKNEVNGVTVQIRLPLFASVSKSD
jgi:two-component system sensor histidine kinase YesM